MIYFKQTHKVKPPMICAVLGITFLLMGAFSSSSLASDMAQKEADIKTSIKACTDAAAANPNLNADHALKTCTCFFTTLIMDYPEEERPMLAQSRPNPNGTVHEKQMADIIKKCASN